MLLLLACTDATSPPASGGRPAALVPVRVALDWFPEPEFGGYYDALLTGRYRDAGLDVTLIPGGPGTPTLEQLAAGSVEVGLTGADGLLVRRAKGLEAVAILPGFQDSPMGLLVHASTPIHRYEDVAGAAGVKVAIEAGSAFQVYTWAKFGWSAVPMVPTTGSIGPFSTDPLLLQQAYITSEPCLTDAKGIETRFLPARDAGWNPYAAMAVVRKADLGAPWVKAFRDATVEGWRHYLADPSTANAEIARLNPDMAGEKLACVTERQRPFVTGTDGVGAMTAVRWEAVAAALTSTGQAVTADGAWAVP